MVKIVDMTSALQQVREKAPDTADAMKRFKSGNAGFTDKSHLKAKGMIPRADGTKKVSPKYEEDAYDNDRFIVKGGAVKKDNSNTPDSKDHVYAPNAKIAKQLHSQGKKVYKEDLDKKDVATIKPIIKQLQKSVKSHDKQAKQLTKDISDEKDLEEQVKDLENQLKTAEQELEELYIKEDKAYVIRFKRIKDKERMVVVFRNQNDADMYADNIKKQGGQVFSNKLEKIPYKVVDKKSK